MFTATLDTSVLWPSLQRDFLLSLAVEGAYRPTWSSAILEELEYHEEAKLVKRGIPVAEAAGRAATLIAAMRREFADAEVEGWEPLEGTFGLPDQDDEHVVAAAVIAGAGAIVTENLKDFPADKIPPTIQVLSAREFAKNTVALNPRRALAAVQEIASRSGRHGAVLTVEEILDTLRDRYGMIEAVEMMVEAASAKPQIARLARGRGRLMSARYPPRSCHESNPADLIEDDVIDVTICGIARFQLSSLAIGAISNPSVSAIVPADSDVRLRAICAVPLLPSPSPNGLVRALTPAVGARTSPFTERRRCWMIP